jgi:hypothetical protein
MENVKLLTDAFAAALVVEVLLRIFKWIRNKNKDP